MSPTSNSLLSKSVTALAAASLLSACASAGGRSRTEESDGNAQPGSYTPPNQTPVTQMPNVQNPSGQMPATQNPAGEMTNDGLPLEPPPQQPSGGSSQLGAATMGGTGETTDRYRKADVTRNGDNYFLMANGWGPNFGSQSISWSGTSFTVESMTGSQGDNYEPASYPTVFCGEYSDSRSRECGLPAALDSLTSLRTGWSWRANGNAGQYNAAYDIWMGTGPARNTFSGYLMVWFREPPGQQPAGRLTEHRGITVGDLPGTWDIWTGQVGNRPIINWVRAEGQDTPSMEFDILDFVDDAEARGLTVPGSHVLSVAVGFEIWNGPITNLESVDFYVDPQ
jgi:hypothetical protein